MNEENEVGGFLYGEPPKMTKFEAYLSKAVNKLESKVAKLETELYLLKISRPIKKEPQRQTLYAIIAIGVIFLAALTLTGCGELEDFRYPPTPTPIAIQPTPTPTPVMLDCDQPFSTDGNAPPEGGFLMKNGDHTGKAVILLPSRFTFPFDYVQVIDKNGSLEEFTYTGKSNHTRQTWRGSRRVRGYIFGDQIYVLAVLGDQECEWIIDEPNRRRND